MQTREKLDPETQALRKAEQQEAKPDLFKKLPTAIVENVIAPMCSLKEQAQGMRTGKNLNQFFKKTFNENCHTLLLHHVLYAEFDQAAFLAEKYPALLLCKGTAKRADTGQTFYFTPLQLARYLKDEEMVAMLFSYMDEDEIKKQFSEQFPDGYEALQKERIAAGFKLLQETFDAIHESKVETEEEYEYKLIIDSKTEQSLTRWNHFLQSKGVIQTGEDITDVFLHRIFQLYEENYARFSIGNVPGVGDRTCDSPKNLLVCCRMIGSTERPLPLNIIQAMSDGIERTIDKKEKGKRQGRTLMFDIWDGKNWVGHDFLTTLVSSPHQGLGVNFAIFRFEGVATGPRWVAWNGKWATRINDAGIFKIYINQKTENLRNLCCTQLELYPCEKSRGSRA